MSKSDTRSITLVFPGDLNTLTGGYRYNKRIVEGLRQPGGSGAAWQVSLVSLNGDYPHPSDAQLQLAEQQFSTIADHELVVIDGLAYSVMPELIARHAQRLRIVALIHHPLALETGLSEAQSQLLQALETRALQHAQHVITTSELTASSLAQYNVPEHKLTAILPGTDHAPLAQGSATKIPNLLCVATLTQRKGHRVLLEALSNMQHLAWQLDCVGSTERDKHTHQLLVEQCETANMLDRVRFMGEVSEIALEQHYSEADVFVLASFHEGYGMVLSEAIARGLPIISCDAGAISQTVPDGTGLLVPPGDSAALASAIASFLTDRQLRSQLRNAALSAREQLRTWPQAAHEFSAVLARLDVNGK